ncbi:hypothetical protein QN416_26640, partial [Glaciimonas sp. Cout2]|uniref:hypothetical protein n=1 Tax=Glaciimonas sp. Cout2 TaxID=3048621 RepID=UPI002B238E73
GLIGEDGDGRANFKYKDLDAMLNDSEVAALHPKIEQLRKSGSEDKICPPFSVTITGINREKIEANAYLQRASSPLIRIRF